jgi:HEAT repeat protein
LHYGIVNRPIVLVLLLAWVGASSTGCAGTRRAPEPPKEERVACAMDDATAQTPRPFYEGTERMQARARELVESIPSAGTEQRYEIAKRLVAMGEPGMPALVGALDAGDADVRGLAAWALGFSNDRRAVPALRRATEDPVPHVALEAAASLLHLGDEAGLARLVDGLDDPDPRLRSRSLMALERRTKRTLDYRPDDPPEERSAAVARWRAWLQTREGGDA